MVILLCLERFQSLSQRIIDFMTLHSKKAQLLKVIPKKKQEQENFVTKKLASKNPFSELIFCLHANKCFNNLVLCGLQKKNTGTRN